MKIVMLLLALMMGFVSNTLASTRDSQYDPELFTGFYIKDSSVYAIRSAQDTGRSFGFKAMSSDHQKKVEACAFKKNFLSQNVGIRLAVQTIPSLPGDGFDFGGGAPTESLLSVDCVPVSELFQRQWAAAYRKNVLKF
jgi:hypothetical protein